MYLKSLELHGFKSFPDKIRLTFDEGFTAVVGPNGSGKSNIGDAVRWVLGEQSTKELRGKSMEDVIFSGTKARKPMGFAAVTLTIDNADHALLNDEPEVAITRKLYRSGDSEYLINGKPVRLKDINELFMDTGLGRDGYAIIGQGRIAEIVGAKSNERRDIFEEAAGVSKFRYRKQEAERRLAAAQDNLLRLSDIVGELESRIGPLKSQAEKAEKYLVLAAERRTLEVSVWVRRLNGMREQLQGLEDTYLKLTAEYENLQSDIDRTEEKIQLAYQDMTQVTVDIETLQNKIVAAEQENADVTAKIAVCRNEILHSNERIAALEQQQSELSDSGDTWEQKLSEQDAYIEELVQRQAALEQKLTDAQAALATLAEQYAAQSASVTKQDAALRQQYLRQSELRVGLQNSEKAITETQESMARADADGSAVAERMQDHAKQKQTLEKQIAALAKKREEQQNRYEGCRQLAALKEQKYQQALESCRNVSSELAQVRQRQQILRDLEQNMEGYAGSVKKIVKAAGTGRLGGVHGTVSQKITVEPKYGTAIETALGGALQNIIVENDEAAKRCMRYLKETNAGRATFLPLTTIRGGRLNERLEGVDGFVALACDLIGYDPIYRNIMEQLLGRIAVAEDLDSASRIAKQFGYRIRLVTLDGQVIHAGGSFTGGSAARSAGVITRTHELEETAERMNQLQDEQNRLQEEANKRKAEWAKLLTDVEGAQALITELDGQQRELQQQLAAAEARAASDAAWQENEAAERKRLADKLEELQNQHAEKKAALEQLEKEISAAEDTLHDDSIEQARLHSEQEMQNKQIADDRIRQAEMQKDVEMERKRRISMAQSMEQAGEQAAQLQEDLRRERSNVTAKEHEIESLTEGQEQRKQDRDAMQTKIGQLRRDHEEKEKYTRLLNEGMKELRDAREKQSAERTRAEERKNTVQKDLDDLVFRLQDAYELTVTEAEGEAQPIENIRDAESQLASLKGKIRALGTVNVAAVDEYKEVSARYQDMTAQLSDIEKAKKELEELIAQLTENMCDIFRKSFVKINEYFGQIFVELFGGGSASLELTDPEHILESGIEIKVAPPGKVIKNLISLSGGEQSFVAICIYFAILKLRPAPFCILDEIDAALDEVNVHKYAQYLKNFFGKVQFVVVTHRRSAMDAANVLYGVTMQEDGISRLLRLDQNGVAVENSEKEEA
ncbi:MAG: chromosome segregation protein SMC [Oscillospiraceae bacterium]|nr:chromosome segregation protein SMC [Oscillospiraceae bacterium]